MIHSYMFVKKKRSDLRPRPSSLNTNVLLSKQGKQPCDNLLELAIEVGLAIIGTSLIEPSEMILFSQICVSAKALGF